MTIGGSLVITGFSTMAGFSVGCSVCTWAVSPLGLLLGAIISLGVEDSFEAGSCVVGLLSVGTTSFVVGLNVVDVVFTVVVVGFTVVMSFEVVLAVDGSSVKGSSVCAVGATRVVVEAEVFAVVDVNC